MMYNTFEGIRYLANGAIKSEYTNVIPLGNTIIDRNGEVVTDVQFPTYSKWIGDSQAKQNFNEDNVRFVSAYVNGDKIYRLYVYNSCKAIAIAITLIPNGVEATNQSVTTSQYTIVTSKSLKTEVSVNADEWTWCCSGIKPSQVYLANSKELLYFTDEDYVLHTLVLPNTIPAVESSDYVENGDNYATVDSLSIKKVVWYDNRLYLLATNGVLYFTCADPAQYYRPTSSTKANWYSLKYGVNYLWSGWITSSLSNEPIENIMCYNGSMYFINKNSFEVWTRTGINDSPIACGVQNGTSISLKHPCVIENTMFAINDDDKSIVVVNGTDTQVVSNGVVNGIVDSMVNPHIEAFSANGEKHCKVVDWATGNAVVISPNTKYWYYLDESKRDKTWIKYYVSLNLGISAQGDFVISNPNISYYSTTRIKTELITRSFVDYFNLFSKRISMPSVTLIADFGSEVDTHSIIPSASRYVYYEDINDDKNLVNLYYSMDKGASFGRPFSRKVPKLGMNAQNITWSGLGSGYSVLLKFQYACRRKVVTYGLEVVNR